MGFLDTKAKAQEFDRMQDKARAVDLHNAELRAAIAEEKASQIAGLARSVLDPRYVMAQNVYTPQASVQDREILEYVVPSLYKQPAAPMQNQGLGWSVAMGNGYNQ